MTVKDLTELQSPEERIEDGHRADLQGLQAGLVQIEHSHSPGHSILATVLSVAAARRRSNWRRSSSMTYVNWQSITVRILDNRRKFFSKPESSVGRIDNDQRGSRIISACEVNHHEQLQETIIIL